ncbi:MAG: HAMP domain-containing protein [Anaerolineales bacterium]|nr:MAG: HAMP domain-containing protein [Anaerolineales bacterium]
MADQKALSGRTNGQRSILNRPGASIGAKIILPYLLLALAVGGVGAFVVTNLVTNSLQERFNNQLLDAGRVVAEGMVHFEEERLAVLRTVSGTQGVAESLAAGDREALAGLVPQIIVNSQTDAVELLDIHGIEVYGWQRPLAGSNDVGEERSGADFSQLDEVRKVLEGFVDEFGNKRVLLAQTNYGLMIFTVGPIYSSGPGEEREQVGAVMVGTYLRKVVLNLSETAVARVTLSDRNGIIVHTTLGGGQEGIAAALQEPPDQYDTVIELLEESPNHYQVVVESEDEVLLREVEILGQRYVLAYGDWRLRGQSFGLFSVALPRNFIVSTAATSRKSLSLLFSIATAAVFAMGFAIANRLVKPLNRLVQTSLAVARGDLGQRTGIQRKDEIGRLAHSFDAMTERLGERNRELAERNRQLMEQASELKAILNGIADGVIVLDAQGQIMTTNPAAQQILGEMSGFAPSDVAEELPLIRLADSKNGWELSQAFAPAVLQQPRRCQVGDRVVSALAAPVISPGGEQLRTVIVLRDITREVEAEQLKDGFITSISHELLTPLTVIKGYSDLLTNTANGKMNRTHLRFVQTIGSNANQLMRHITKLIDISQIQAGALGLRQERLCFSELVEEAVENWRERMESKGLSLRMRLSGGQSWIFGDRRRLLWAADNLLSNAYNYTLALGNVEVRLFKEDDQVRLDVADTGVGVAAADQPYLFSRFFRANNELTCEVRGVGLGLYITQAIVKLHGGRVWAESEVGVGSTFSVALPLSPTDATTGSG